MCIHLFIFDAKIIIDLFWSRPAYRWAQTNRLEPKATNLVKSIHFQFHAVIKRMWGVCDFHLQVLVWFVNVSQVEEQNTYETADDRGVCARALYDYQAGEYCFYMINSVFWIYLDMHIPFPQFSPAYFCPFCSCHLHFY